ncbi:uDP-N-acetylglucosamine 1-carboxyvinyltransferase 2 [Firmicutes bacterium CAG:582]|nr:uDP-N-acetylglucosamine 1-carboxyvinyltransferase 2 [Firmicutes bacterium CAG:582]
MKKLVIEGGRDISGTIKISGAKNSIVALIPASILTSGVCVITNVPDISDVRILIDMMRELGSIITFENEVLTIDNSNVQNKKITEEYAGKLRASYYFMGSLIGKYHEAEIAYPGGCVIGSRPINYHIESFKKMGINVKNVADHYIMKTDELKGNEFYFDFPSVGATINIMLAAILAKGKTIIYNAAKEPEIANVASFLNSMGAKVFGAGTSTIEIIGVEELHDGFVEVIPDRIEAGTYIMIGALIGNNLKIENIVEKHLESLLYKLKEAGVKYEINDNSIILSKVEHLKPVNIKTTVYPGFPTDLGQPMSTFLTQCEGESLFEETIYENRLRHVPHLNSMGANIQAFDKKAIIIGKTPLVGKKVKATDLRAGASMLVAGLIATGTTEIQNIEHLLRGYERIVEKLESVGVNIKLIDE